MSETKNEPVKEIFFCSHCGNKTSHIRVYLHVQKWPIGEMPNGEDLMECSYIMLFECTTCNKITLKELFEADIDDPRHVDMENVRTLYPVVKKFSRELTSKQVIQIYNEATRIKRISPLAFSILIRKALEALCDDQKTEGKHLAEKIKFLATKNNLPEVFTEMIDSIRILGNKGAHEIDIKVTNEQADTLDYFFNVIVEYLYIAPQKINLLKKSLLKH